MSKQVGAYKGRDPSHVDAASLLSDATLTATKDPYM